MWRWALRYGAIRVVGRRALPVLMLWDAAVLANKARQIPAVDRNLRRGVSAAAKGAESILVGRQFRGPAMGRRRPATGRDGSQTQPGTGETRAADGR
jgi:hypothetical protein